MEKILRIARRGASAYFPENSMRAFEKAIELGLDIVEFDVRMTKDKQVIVMHDQNVKRTTDGFGLIKNLTLKQIRKLHLKDGGLVPTLEEAVRLLKNRTGILIDIKDVGMERKIVQVIEKESPKKIVILSSDWFKVSKEIKKIDKDVKVGVGGFRKTKMESLIKRAEQIHAWCIQPHHSLITKSLVNKAHKNGIMVLAWGVDTKQQFKKMKIAGVDGVISYCPDEI